MVKLGFWTSKSCWETSFLKPQKLIASYNSNDVRRLSCSIMFTRCSQDELLIWLSYFIDTHDVFDEDYSLMPSFHQRNHDSCPARYEARDWPSINCFTKTNYNVCLFTILHFHPDDWTHWSNLLSKLLQGQQITSLFIHNMLVTWLVIKQRKELCHEQFFCA